MTGALLPLFEKIAALPVDSKVTKVVSSPQVVNKPVAAAPPKPKSRPTPKPGGLPLFGLSIKRNTGAAPKESVNTLVETSSVNESVNYTNQAIDVSYLRTLWTQYANSEKGIVQQILSSTIPDLKDNTIVSIMLENNFQADKVSEIKKSLLPFLREGLQNNQITLEIVISEGTEFKRAFTPKEKLEEMIKENSALGDLISKLGLEIE